MCSGLSLTSPGAGGSSNFNTVHPEVTVALIIDAEDQPVIDSRQVAVGGFLTRSGWLPLLCEVLLHITA